MLRFYLTNKNRGSRSAIVSVYNRCIHLYNRSIPRRNAVIDVLNYLNLNLIITHCI